MRTKTYTISGIDASANGIVTAQAIVAGVPLTLQAAAANLDPPRRITIDGSATISGSFVVVGLDRWGNVQTETITGVTTTEVNSLGLYSKITSITPTASDADTVTVGWPVGGATPWVLCGRAMGVDQVPECSVSVLATVGAADGDLQVTFDMFPRLTEPEIGIDETQAVTPGTPLRAKGQGVRFVMSTGAGTTAKVKFTRPGP